MNRLANALSRLEVGAGDRVGVFLPMSPEAAIAMLATVRIGAISVPCFSGFGAHAVASRLSDCEAKVLLTADGFHRRGHLVKLKETADEAVRNCASVSRVIVHRRLDRQIPWHYGFWFIQGRSDDTLKIAGKRLGPAEVESVLVGHPAVAEAGAIGVPHEVKGEAVVCFVVLRPGHFASESLRAELAERVAEALGRALKPERVLFARELPKTRSAKIMRRVIRATYLGKEPGDLSSIENPDAMRAIAEAI